MIAADSKNLKN